MEPATPIFHLLNPLPPKRKRLALGTRSTPNATGSSWDAAGWFPPCAVDSGLDRRPTGPSPAHMTPSDGEEAAEKREGGPRGVADSTLNRRKGG